jgi:hypothetical protein
MASQLLVVVGNKINNILEASFDANLVAILSTNLSSWLKSLVIRVFFYSNKLDFSITNIFIILRGHQNIEFTR